MQTDIATACNGADIILLTDSNSIAHALPLFATQDFCAALHQLFCWPSLQAHWSCLGAFCSILYRLDIVWITNSATRCCLPFAFYLLFANIIVHVVCVSHCLLIGSAEWQLLCVRWILGLECVTLGHVLHSMRGLLLVYWCVCVCSVS